MTTRILFGLISILTLGGATAAAIGMHRSRELTGDWIGYGIPSEELRTLVVAEERTAP